jgi:hypothetical protein
MFRSTGSNLQLAARYDGDIPGWGGLRGQDMLYVGDFNGDGKKDLYIFNGTDWNMPYLGMFRSTGSGLQMAARYDGDVPGWGGLAQHDAFLAADINGDGKTDLFAYNFQDWVTEYLGRMISNGSALSADFVGDWLGEWNLGAADRFEVGNFQGRARGRRPTRGYSGQPDLFVHNQDWFGMIRGNPQLALQRIYYRWIHNYRYGRNW